MNGDRSQRAAVDRAGARAEAVTASPASALEVTAPVASAFEVTAPVPRLAELTAPSASAVELTAPLTSALAWTAPVASVLAVTAPGAISPLWITMRLERRSRCRRGRRSGRGRPGRCRARVASACVCSSLPPWRSRWSEGLSVGSNTDKTLKWRGRVHPAPDTARTLWLWGRSCAAGLGRIAIWPPLHAQRASMRALASLGRRELKPRSSGRTYRRGGAFDTVGSGRCRVRRWATGAR